MRYTRIVNEIKLSQVVDSRYKESVDFVLNWKPGQKVPNPRYIEYKNDVSNAFGRATHKLGGANVYTVWDAQRKDGEEPFDKYSFPSSVLHVPGFLKRAPKQLKRIKSRSAIRLIKEVITALKPWEEIAEKIKAMKGDVVKRQVGHFPRRLKMSWRRLVRDFARNLRKPSSRTMRTWLANTKRMPRGREAPILIASIVTSQIII